MYLGVSLKLVQNAVAPSTERAYQGYFRSWVEFRFNVIHEPVYQEFSNENPMANVRSLSEYTSSDQENASQLCREPPVSY